MKSFSLSIRFLSFLLLFSPVKYLQAKTEEPSSANQPIKMDVQTRAYLDKMNTLSFIPIEKISIELLRISPSPYGYESKAVIKKTEEFSIPGPSGAIPLRIYTPEGKG